MVRDPGICDQRAIKDYFSGVHHKKSNCDSNAGLDKVKSIIESSKQHFFPERYIFHEILHKEILTLICFSLQFVRTTLRKKIKEKKPNGGWGDKRDHALCLNFTLPGSQDNTRQL